MKVLSPSNAIFFKNSSYNCLFNFLFHDNPAYPTEVIWHTVICGIKTYVGINAFIVSLV